jgi:hypothetical protein
VQAHTDQAAAADHGADRLLGNPHRDRRFDPHEIGI